MVDRGGMFSDERVAVGEVVGRCFPKWTRRRDDGGSEVRRESNWRRVGIVVEDGIFSGMAMMTVNI